MRWPQVVRHTYRAVVAYDGSAFCGFAKQPGLRTVESELLRGLRTHLTSLPAIQVGGRTDKGVHAVGQVISFYGPEAVEPAVLREAMNMASPNDIVALEVQEVPRSFHAQYSAVSRRYTYFLRDDGQCDASLVDAMLSELQGTRCFGAFTRDIDRGKNTVRTLSTARARRTFFHGQDAIRFDFEANSFLRSQVRVLVATAVREALSNAPRDRLKDLAEAQDRRLTAPPAPPDGLYLVCVRYGVLGLR